MKPYLTLEEGLNDVAVLRTVLETLEMFSAGDAICTEMQPLLRDAREGLISHLQELHDRLQNAPDSFAVDFERLRSLAIDMMTRGFPGRQLNQFMRLDAFDEGESSLYYFEAAGLVDIDTAQRMPPHAFTLLLLDEVLHAAQNQAHYTDKPTFDRQVFQKYIALMFLCYAATDPVVYGRMT